jgi:hypothetical protein
MQNGFNFFSFFAPMFLPKTSLRGFGLPSSNSSVSIRAFHGEGIRQMSYFPNRALFQKHFDDIEARFYLRISQQPQIVQRGAGEASTPLAIDGGGRPHPFF